MNRDLASFEAPELTFDKLDAFGKRSGGGVVFLTCTSVPESLLQMVDALRQDLEAAGCVIESDFKLHVTLGRVDKDVHVEADLLPKALGLRNGDAKIIKNAGGLVLSQTDSAIRSLLVAIYELGVEEVMVVHHSTCGACHMSYEEFRPHMLERGVSPQTLSEWEGRGIGEWLEGFHDTEASVRKTVSAIVSHPLMPKDVTVRGFIIDSVTGALTEVQ